MNPLPPTISSASVGKPTVLPSDLSKKEPRFVAFSRTTLGTALLLSAFQQHDTGEESGAGNMIDAGNCYDCIEPGSNNANQSDDVNDCIIIGMQLLALIKSEPRSANCEDYEELDDDSCSKGTKDSIEVHKRRCLEAASRKRGEKIRWETKKSKIPGSASVPTKNKLEVCSDPAFE